GRDVVRGPDPGEYLVPCGVGELAPADRLVQGGAQPGHALVQESLVDLDRDDAAAAAGEQLGNARAHEPKPDHCDFADIGWLLHATGHVVEPFASKEPPGSSPTFRGRALIRLAASFAYGIGGASRLADPWCGPSSDVAIWPDDP